MIRPSCTTTAPTIGFGAVRPAPHRANAKHRRIKRSSSFVLLLYIDVEMLRAKALLRCLFVLLLSSFLALTQEKKQKKVKASGTPANFPSPGKDYQGRRPIIELNGSAYLTPPSGYPANRGRRPTSQPRKGPFLASRQEKKIEELPNLQPDPHYPFSHSQ